MDPRPVSVGLACLAPTCDTPLSEPSLFPLHPCGFLMGKHLAWMQKEYRCERPIISELSPCGSFHSTSFEGYIKCPFLASAVWASMYVYVICVCWCSCVEGRDSLKYHFSRAVSLFWERILSLVDSFIWPVRVQGPKHAPLFLSFYVDSGA